MSEKFNGNHGGEEKIEKVKVVKVIRAMNLFLNHDSEQNEILDSNYDLKKWLSQYLYLFCNREENLISAIEKKYDRDFKKFVNLLMPFREQQQRHQSSKYVISPTELLWTDSKIVDEQRVLCQHLENRLVDLDETLYRDTGFTMKKFQNQYSWNNRRLLKWILQTTSSDEIQRNKTLQKLESQMVNETIVNVDNQSSSSSQKKSSRRYFLQFLYSVFFLIAFSVIPTASENYVLQEPLLKKEATNWLSWATSTPKTLPFFVVQRNLPGVPLQEVKITNPSVFFSDDAATNEENLNEAAEAAIKMYDKDKPSGLFTIFDQTRLILLLYYKKKGLKLLQQQYTYVQLEQNCKVPFSMKQEALPTTLGAMQEYTKGVLPEAAKLHLNSLVEYYLETYVSRKLMQNVDHLNIIMALWLLKNKATAFQDVDFLKRGVAVDLEAITEYFLKEWKLNIKDKENINLYKDTLTRIIERRNFFESDNQNSCVEFVESFKSLATQELEKKLFKDIAAGNNNNDDMITEASDIIFSEMTEFKSLLDYRFTTEAYQIAQKKIFTRIDEWAKNQKEVVDGKQIAKIKTFFEDQNIRVKVREQWAFNSWYNLFPLPEAALQGIFFILIYMIYQRTKNNPWGFRILLLILGGGEFAQLKNFKSQYQQWRLEDVSSFTFDNFRMPNILQILGLKETYDIVAPYILTTLTLIIGYMFQLFWNRKDKLKTQQLQNELLEFLLKQQKKEDMENNEKKRLGNEEEIKELSKEDQKFCKENTKKLNKLLVEKKWDITLDCDSERRRMSKLIHPDHYRSLKDKAKEATTEEQMTEEFAIFNTCFLDKCHASKKKK